VNGITLSLTRASVPAALVILMGSVAYAEPNVGICDVLHGSTTKGLYGLCVAYCEAQDCQPTIDETTGELTFGKNCGPSSAKTLAKYNSRLEPGDTPMPCVNPAVGECPCWTEAEIDEVADLSVHTCQDSPTLTVLWGRDSTENLDYAGVQIDTSTQCYYLEQSPTQILRYQAVDEAAYTACRLSTVSECIDRGYTIP
jgi:hypothetical protein